MMFNLLTVNYFQCLNDTDGDEAANGDIMSASESEGAGSLLMSDELGYDSCGSSGEHENAGHDIIRASESEETGSFTANSECRSRRCSIEYRAAYQDIKRSSNETQGSGTDEPHQDIYP